MAPFVAAIGAIMLLVSAAILVAPSSLKQLLSIFAKKGVLHVAVALRVAIGVVFIIAAPDTRWPTFVGIVGVVVILAGMALVFIGTQRVERFVVWWLDKPDGVLRSWAVLGGAFGALILLAGL